MEPIPSAWLLLSMPLLAVLVGLVIKGTKRWRRDLICAVQAAYWLAVILIVCWIEILKGKKRRAL